MLEKSGGGEERRWKRAAAKKLDLTLSGVLGFRVKFIF